MPKIIKTTPENAVKNEILQLLHRLGIYHWRHNVGAVKRNGKMIRYGAPGQSDIMGVLPGGRFLAIECKDFGKQPTSAQNDFLNHMTSLGALAFVAWSVRDVELAFSREGLI